MCGIAGYFLKNGQQPPSGCLEGFAAALHHRGPDGWGKQVMDGAGFVQTRLAIIDLEGGKQPFIRPENKNHGRQMLIANGEIYNYQQLRAEYADYPYVTQSDCEVILPLYQQNQENFAPKLRGMYAFAIYDEQQNKGCLSRDSFGIKPLYYAEDHTGVYFASERRALAKILGLTAALDDVSAMLVLDRQYMSPSDCPDARIKSVLPGQTLFISGGEITHQNQDNPLDITGSSPSHADEFQAYFSDSIAAHQIADVDVGLFLSGGVDSASILQEMTDQQRQDISKKLHAYSVRFDTGTLADETLLARQLAEQCDAEFVDVTYTADDFLHSTGKAVWAIDMPVADYAILPSFALAERAAQDVKVVLSGEGGDEFFAGYGRYRHGMRAFAHRPLWRAGPALQAGLIRPHIEKQFHRLTAQHVSSLPNFWTCLRHPDRALQQVQRYDIDRWLPDNLLVKLDRILMANSLEGRTPFIDRALSPFGYHLPARQKIRGKKGKYAVKKWLEQKLPAARPFDRKRGFTVPVGNWIADHHHSLVPLVMQQPDLQKLVNTSLLSGLFRDGASSGLLAWRVLFLALWNQIHIHGADPHQPIHDILNHR